MFCLDESNAGHSLIEEKSCPKQRIGAERKMDVVKPMIKTKFVVKVNRVGSRPEYVQRIDRSPIRMTNNRKQALIMGRFTAEDVVDSLQHHSRCSPELLSLEVHS